jgi:thioredoxin 1
MSDKHLTSLTFAEFQTLYTTNEIYLLDFYADWCGPCQMLTPELVKLEKLYPSIKFRGIDVDAQQEFAANFEVRSIPSVFVVKFTGVSFDVLAEFKGNKDPFSISQILDKVLASQKTDEKN